MRFSPSAGTLQTYKWLTGLMPSETMTNCGAMAEKVMTKSNKRGGKRPGAGRPTLGGAGKRATISTRIEAETRDLVEAESERTGDNLSTTVGKLIKLGLSKKRELERDDPTKAICGLIEELAERIPGPYSRDGSYHWRESPFMFEAFRKAVLHLLDEFRPEGEVVPPPPKHPAFRLTIRDNAEQHGLDTVKALVWQVQFHANESGWPATEHTKDRPLGWNEYGAAPPLAFAGKHFQRCLTFDVKLKKDKLAEAGNALRLHKPKIAG